MRSIAVDVLERIAVDWRQPKTGSPDSGFLIDSIYNKDNSKLYYYLGDNASIFERPTGVGFWPKQPTTPKWTICTIPQALPNNWHSTRTFTGRSWSASPDFLTHCNEQPLFQRLTT